ncbi:cytochrome c [Marinicellulosiphila megalodicopiae]|uniref:cytochrome c n=1 Tax=Marinicellulosiphila megalodicopiae TaxID=2724896 RepID=UPI003BB12B0F
MTLTKTLSSLTLLCVTSFTLNAADMKEMTITESIEARQEIMKKYKSWDKKLDSQFKAEQADSAILKEAAKFFQANSSDAFLAFFPEKVTPDGVKTAAKSGIWRSWEEFSAITNDVNLQASEALQFLENGDIKSATSSISEITNSCRSCHKKFKAR